MERNFSDYSIPELQEALATVDARAHPENKADLERELQARKVIGVYFIASAVYAVAGVSLNASSTLAGAVTLALMALFLVASFLSGVGLLREKDWGHWIAVAVLGLQLIKVQFAGFSFGVLSLVGIYLFVDGNASIGITASFDPGFAVSVGQYAPLWIGVNIFCAVLMGYLFTARERVD